MEIFRHQDKNIVDIIREKKNLVFVGEAGSGKSEVAINIATKIAEGKFGKCRGVDLFDMDQTKPLFRTRDLSEKLSSCGVNVYYQEQYLDAPSVVGGVNNSLMSDKYTILDIGGGQQAAKVVGVYNHLLRGKDSEVIYILNPYRPWTRNSEGIAGTLNHILRSIRLDGVYLLANPNLGRETDINDFLSGLDEIDKILGEVARCNSACVTDKLFEDASRLTDKQLIPITKFLTYEWE